MKFQGQAGPRQVDVSRLDARLQRTAPGMVWVAIFGSRYAMDLLMDNLIW